MKNSRKKEALNEFFFPVLKTDFLNFEINDNFSKFFVFLQNHNFLL
jgi:hypothetical protein